MIDGFNHYISGHCRTYCEQNNIRYIEAVSPYICGIFEAKGNEVPPPFRAPYQEDDIISWAIENELINEDTMEINPNVFVLSESDSGVSTAEKIASVLNLAGKYRVT